MFDNIRPFYTKYQHKIIYGGSAFLILLTLYTGYRYFFAPSPPAEQIKVVEVEKAQKKIIQQTARFIGTIIPKRSTVLIAKAPGTLDYLLPAGQFVKKGTLIAKIDNADRERRYMLSKSGETIARGQYERFKAFSGAGHSKKKDVEDIKQAWIESEKTLMEAKIDLDQTQFLAPFDGIIGVFKAHEGTQVEAGNPVVSFYDPSSLMVEFEVPSSYIPLIRDGQTVHINGKTYPLTHVQRMIDEETHMCPAYVDIACEACVIGETTFLDLTIQEKQDAIVIPFEAIFLKDSKPFVYVVKDGKTVQTAVTTGIREKEQVEITSGVQPGDSVIVRGQARLSPDMAVKIAEDSQK